MSTRRNFLGLLAGSISAPSVVRASSLMPVYVPPRVLYGDGVHDDWSALTAWLDGLQVIDARSGQRLQRVISGGLYRLSDTLDFGRSKGRDLLIRGAHFMAPIHGGPTIAGLALLR